MFFWNSLGFTVTQWVFAISLSRIMVEVELVGRDQIIRKKVNFILLVEESLRSLSREVTEYLFVRNKTLALEDNVREDE